MGEGNFVFLWACGKKKIDEHFILACSRGAYIIKKFCSEKVVVVLIGVGALKGMNTNTVYTFGFKIIIIIIKTVCFLTPDSWHMNTLLRRFFFYFLVYGSSNPNFCILKRNKILFLTFFIFSDVKNCQI